METASHHLAQVNVARMRAPLTEPLMAAFAAGLEPINRLTDQSPGFVWRLQADDGDATSLRAFGDDMILVNLSTWTDVQALKDYVYGSQHVNYVKRRKAWFRQFAGAYYALWWVPAGRRPTVEEAKARLDRLDAHGESEYAFSFRDVFSPPVPQDRPSASGAA